MTMPAWYIHITPFPLDVTNSSLYYRVRTYRFDMQSFDFESGEDESGMLRTVSSVNQLISAEIECGIDPGRIVVGGFSQGAAISVLTGLTNDRKLAGVACLSGWILLRRKLKTVSRFSCPLGTHAEDKLSRCVLKTRRRHRSFGVMALPTRSSHIR